MDDGALRGELPRTYCYERDQKVQERESG
jgi:hypothetical protein